MSSIVDVFERIYKGGKTILEGQAGARSSSIMSYRGERF